MNIDKKTPDSRIVIKDNEKFDDMRLDRNGTKTTLKTEVARKVLSYQKSGVNDFLRHDIMVITCTDESDTPSCLVESALAKTGVNWNVLSFREKKFLYDKPEILRFLKPVKTIAAAKKAGIVKKNYGQNTLNLILMILLCSFFCGMGFIISDGYFSSKSSLFQLSGILQNRGFIISCGAGCLAAIFVQRFIIQHRLVNDTDLMKKITNYADQIDSNSNIGSSFLHNVKEEIFNLQMPMAIVVRDIEFMDIFTKRVLADILTVEKEQNVGLIFWIFLDYEKSGTENELVSLVRNKGTTALFSYQNYRFESYL